MKKRSRKNIGLKEILFTLVLLRIVSWIYFAGSEANFSLFDSGGLLYIAVILLLLTGGFLLYRNNSLGIWLVGTSGLIDLLGLGDPIGYTLGIAILLFSILSLTLDKKIKSPKPNPF